MGFPLTNMIDFMFGVCVKVTGEKFKATDDSQLQPRVRDLGQFYPRSIFHFLSRLSISLCFTCAIFVLCISHFRRQTYFVKRILFSKGRAYFTHINTQLN